MPEYSPYSVGYYRNPIAGYHPYAAAGKRVWNRMWSRPALYSALSRVWVDILVTFVMQLLQTSRWFRTTTGRWIRRHRRRGRFQLPVVVEIISKSAKVAWQRWRGCPHSRWDRVCLNPPGGGGSCVAVFLGVDIISVKPSETFQMISTSTGSWIRSAPESLSKPTARWRRNHLDNFPISSRRSSTRVSIVLVGLGWPLGYPQASATAPGHGPTGPTPWMIDPYSYLPVTSQQ